MPRTSHIRAGLGAAVKAGIALAVAACGFHPAGGGDDDDDIITIDAATDAPIDGVTIAPLCDGADPDLRLCLDFEGAVASGGSATLAIDTMNVDFIDGAVGASARVTSASVIHVDETSALDFTDAMTIEAFVQAQPDPVPDPRAGIVDNNGQYSMWLNAEFAPYCTGNGSTVTGNPMVPGSWVHVACVLDNHTYTLYQGGVMVRQVAHNSALTTTFGDGVNVGQDNRGTNMSGDPLNGSIDELRVWSVARTAAQIADAAARP